MPTASSPTIGAYRRVSAFCVAGLALSTAFAADEPRFGERPLDVSVYFEHVRIDLEYPGMRVPTRVDRIGVRWQEHYAPITLGLVGGWSWATQTDNPATAGLQLDGYHVGITFDTELFARAPFRVTAGASYRYERVEEKTGATQIEQTWRLPAAELRGHWRVTPTWELYGGVHYGYVDGEERVQGASPTTRDSERDSTTGGLAGIALHLDREGYVALEASSGPVRRATLGFGRRF